MIRTLFCSFFLLISSQTYSQHNIFIKGKLVEAKTQNPIAYANIGIINTGVGTHSNEDGTYELRIDSTMMEDNIVFSALGFDRASYSVKDILHNEIGNIALEEKVTLLKEVAVSSKSSKLKRKKTDRFGNDYSTSGTIRMDTSRAGGAIALLIESKKIPAKIMKAQLYLRQNSNEAAKIRVRFYRVDEKTGEPGENLFEKNIIVTADRNKGWLKIDLEDQNLWVFEEHFFVAFEWLTDKNDRMALADSLKSFIQNNPENLVKDTTLVNGKEVIDTKIKGFDQGTWFGTTFAAKVANKNTSYYRLNSLGRWRRSSSILTAVVEVW